MSENDVPRCPRCNANDIETVSDGDTSGLSLRSHCRRCGHRWSRRWLRRRYTFETISLCPVCRERGHVTSTRESYRWLRCAAGHTWKQTGRPLPVG